MKIHGPLLPTILVVVLLIFAGDAFADEPLAENKQTVLGFYVDAKTAFEKWRQDPGETHIVDVRTPAEYLFVGHAPMAANVPLKFLLNEVDLKENQPVMQLNENFVADIKKRFDVTDTLFLMCRSGTRSASAANLLAAAGFKHVYSVTDGFEGDALKHPGANDDGKRTVNGWKNSGSPWTYELDPKLIYRP